jgi:hypothetical protein
MLGSFPSVKKPLIYIKKKNLVIVTRRALSHTKIEDLINFKNLETGHLFCTYSDIMLQGLRNVILGLHKVRRYNGLMVKI